MKKTTLRQVAMHLALLLFVVLAPLGLRAQETLTVYDGTTENGYVPAYILYWDDFTRSQFVIPAADLTDMDGGEISSIKFYTTSQNVPYTSVSTADVYLMEVDYTTITALEPKADATMVYQGTVSVVSEGNGGSLTITFTTPYTYNGGNLLIGIENTTNVNYKSIYFYGQTVSGASWAGSNGSSLDAVTGSQRNFIPKTTFTYEPPQTGSCPKPGVLQYSDVAAHTATISWDGGDAAQWNVYLNGTQTGDSPVSTASYTFSGLTAETPYSVSVEAICGSETSDQRNGSFTTTIACPVPTALTPTLTMGNGSIATLSWTAGGVETAWTLEYGTASDFTGATSVDISGTPSLNLTGLTPETPYYARVKAVCGGDDGVSQWSTTATFTPSDSYSLTVNDGTTTNSYLPMYGNYFDDYTKSEFIIPASSLQAMTWGTINAVTFYTQDVGSSSWNNTNQKVFLKEVSSTTLGGSYSGMDDATIVFDGQLTMPTSNSSYTITFQQGYTYTGGNLLIGVYNDDDGTYNNVYWYGVTASSGVSAYGSNGSSLNNVSFNQQNFLPKTTFEFTPGEEPTCYKPTATSVDAYDQTTATLSWTPDQRNQEGGSYSIVWVTADAGEMVLNGNTTPAATINGTTATISGLTENTEYSFKVKTICAEQETVDDVEFETFTTLANCPIPSNPMADDITAHSAVISWTGYDNDSYNIRYQIPNDLNQDFENGLGEWTANITSSSSGIGSIAHNGSHGFTFYYSEQNASLVSPLLNGTENGCSISFFYKEYNSDYGDEQFQVGYTTDENVTSAADFTYGNTVTASTTWQQYEATFPAGTKRIAIKYIYNDAYYLYVDDIEIAIPNNVWTEASSTTTSLQLSDLDAQTTYNVKVQGVCGNDMSEWSTLASFTTTAGNVAPTLSGVTDITTTMATVNWTLAPGNTFHAATELFVVRTDTATALPATIAATTTGFIGINDAAATYYQLTNLSAGKTYKVWARVYCGQDGTSQWTGPVTFTTDCDVINANDYAESFDSYTAGANVLPNCWSYINTTTYSYNQVYPRVYNSYAHSGNNSLYLYSTYYSSDYDPQPQYAILPEMDDLSGMRVSLWAKGYNANSTFKVGTMNNPADATTFTEVIEAEGTALTTTYQELIFDIPTTADKYVAIMIEAADDSRTSNGVYIDDISIAPTPTCYKPTATTVGAYDQTTATLSWTADERNQDGGSYSIVWVTADAGEVELNDNSTPAAVVNGTSATLSGLTENTAYSFKVRTNCAEQETVEDVVFEPFTTLANCVIPQLAENGITVTAHSADVTWTDNVEGDNYTVSYREAAYFDGITEEFGTAIPTGWENKSGLLTTVMDGGALSNVSSWYFGSRNGVFDNHARINIYSDNKYGWLITPSTEVSTGFVLNFDVALTAYDGTVAAPSTSGTDDRFVVLITTDDMSTWSILREWNNNGSEYVYNNIACLATGENVAIDLSAYAGQTVRVAFYGESTVSNADNNLHIDNVGIGQMVDATDWVNIDNATNPQNIRNLQQTKAYEVKVIHNCTSATQESATLSFTTLAGNLPPTLGEVTEITTTTATVNWTLVPSNTFHAATELFVVCTDTATALPATIAATTTGFIGINDAAATSYQLTNLSAGKTYKVWARVWCGQDGTSQWAGPQTFTTDCEAFSIPFIEDFENGISCWSLVDCAPGTGVQSNYPVSGTKSFKFNYNTNPPQYLISPELSGVEEGTLVSFMYRVHQSSYPESFAVGYSTTTDDVAEFTWFDEQTNLTNTTYQNYSETLPVGVKYVAVKYTANNQYYLYIDDFKVIVPTTVQKEVLANMWYAIATPVQNSSVDDIDGLTSTNAPAPVAYDLYEWNEGTGIWSKPASLSAGKGYIYRRAEATTLSFTGEANSGPVNVTVTASCPDNDLKGFNLVGNPYPFAISRDNFYRLDLNGSWNVVEENATIDPAEGFMVYTEEANGTVSFTEPTGAKGAPTATESLMFTLKNGTFKDVAYARFGSQSAMPKLGHLNAAAPVLSIPVDGRSYAIAQLADDCEQFDLAFRGTEGDYTISLGNATTAFAYIHLIDRLTGRDIDLLRQPSYSFSHSGLGSTANRFAVMLRPAAGTASSDLFARWNGTNWEVEGNGKLQVFDVVGRPLFGTEVDRQTTIDNAVFPAAGVYILRLGDKTQKIVVK